VESRTLIQPDIEFISYLKKNGGDTLKKCYQCASCSVVCSLSPQQEAFPRKEMISASWGQKENLLSNPDIWLCHGCTDCSTYCPRGAKPGDVLGAIRSYVIKFFAFPKFMGSLTQDRKNILSLLLLPILILVGVLFAAHNGDISHLYDGEIIFSKFFLHGILDPFFIITNILVYSFAGIGLYRFWKNLKSHEPLNNNKSFMVVFISTIIGIFSHKDFNQCSTKSSRYWGHLLLFYGFIGALLTTTLVAVSEIFFNFPPPIPLESPIKILGNISGLLMLVGGIVILIRRLSTKADKSINTYNDWLLVVFVLGVTVSGILTQGFRLLEVPVLAYSTYFIHLVFILYLFWYAPYSKMAHMFYRTLALVYLKQHRREKKMTIFESFALFFFKL